MKRICVIFCFKTPIAKHSQSTEKAVLDRIGGHGRGWVFTPPRHFLDLASRPLAPQRVIQALRHLGPEHVTPERIARLRVTLTADDRRALLKDLTLAPRMGPAVRTPARIQMSCFQFWHRELKVLASATLMLEYSECQKLSSMSRRSGGACVSAESTSR